MTPVIIGLNVDFNAGKYQVAAAYLDCVIAAGGFPLLVPCHRDLRVLQKYVALVAGFLFIGGWDYPQGQAAPRRGVLVDPRRSKADLYLARAVLQRKIPLLGICGGHQLLNIALGGRLIPHLPDAARHQKTRHAVAIKGGKILRRLFGPKRIMVNSHHHQAVAPVALGRGLEPVALAAGGVVEAFEAPGHPFLLGVQWHPERMPWRGHGAKIFGAFIKAAGG